MYITTYDNKQVLGNEPTVRKNSSEGNNLKKIAQLNTKSLMNFIGFEMILKLSSR